MQLRPYQNECVEAVLTGWREFRKLLVVSPTGSGKTLIFSALANRLQPLRVLILAHREELIDQAILKLYKSTGLMADKEKAEHKASLSAQVVVGSVQTMTRRLGKWPQDHFGVVIVDEAHHCFPAGTLIDGKKIENVLVGDTVRSYNHETNSIRQNRVKATMRRQVETILRIRLNNGKSIVCTPDHPIWNGHNYVAASTFSRESIVYEELHKREDVFGMLNSVPTEIMEFVNDPLLLTQLQAESVCCEVKKSYCKMSYLRKRLHRFREVPFSNPNRKNLLQQSLFGNFHGGTKLFENGNNKSEIRIKEDERKKSDEEHFIKGEDAIQNDRETILKQDGERSIHSPSNHTIQFSVFGNARSICFGVGSFNKRSKQRNAKLLQDGYWTSDIQDINRGGWKISLKAYHKSERRGQNQLLNPVRVDSVEVFKRGYSEGFERLCPDGFVYNIEVERDNNYFANGFLVHNCLASTYQRVLGHFTNAKVLGVTATPDRGDKKNLGKYFEHVAYEIGLFELIHQGYLAKISVQSLPVEIDLAGVRTTTGDYNESDLGDALAPWLGAIARQIAKHASFRRTLIFLPLCATSRTMVEQLNATGLSACHVDGNSPDRAEILRDFANGRYDVLCNAMLLTEGFDDPGIDCVCVLRPTKSRALFCQMVGRGTRPAPCKTDLLLLDFLWQHTQHNLIRPAHLIASNSDQAEEMQRMIDAEAVAEVTGGEYSKQQILDLEGVASEAQVAREKRLKEELEAKAKRAAKTIDAMEFCLQLHVPDVAEFEPMNAYESAPVSEGQKKRLTDNGIDPDTVQNRGQASKIIDTIIQRARLNLATPKQVKWLTKFGVPSPHTISFDAASAYLTQKFNRGNRPNQPQQHRPQTTNA